MMLNSKVLGIVLMVACSCSAIVVKNYYEETLTYLTNPLCKPNRLDKGVKCSNIGPSIQVAGGIYDTWGLHYTPLASAYYAARIADAMGYQDFCPTNRTFLRELDLLSIWSGEINAKAADISCGSKRIIQRFCSNPTNQWPFICQGTDGSSATFAKRLETLSYISILQGSNGRWVVFANCWNAKTPQNLNSVETATSFLVLSLDPVLSAADKAIILAELAGRGFNTSPSNIIEFDFTSTNC